MLAWRAGFRTRVLPAARWSPRPSTLFPKRVDRCLGFARYASEATNAPATSAASAASEAAKEIPRTLPKQARRRSRKGLYGSLAVVLLVGYVYGLDTRASIHRYAVVPLIRLFYPDAEDAHHFGVENLKFLYRFGLHPRERGNVDSDGALATEVGSFSPVECSVWLSC